MSRTKGHGTGGCFDGKPRWWEGYDSKRPMAWCGFGKKVKKMTHKIERVKKRQLVHKIIKGESED